MLVDIVWRTTPKIKIIVSHIRAHRRPRRSASGALVKAPRKVPAERIETITDCCEGETLRLPVESIYPVENRFFQYLDNDQVDAKEGRSQNSSLHGQYSTYRPCVVSEEYTTKGNEKTDNNGWDCRARHVSRLPKKLKHGGSCPMFWRFHRG
jgi:hypothetical protein